MDLPTTWTFMLGLARVMGISKSGYHQSSASLRNSKSGRDPDVCSGVSGPGPLWHGTEDEHTLGHSAFQW